MKLKDKRLHIAVTRDFLSYLEMVAEQKEMSVSEYARTLLIEGSGYDYKYSSPIWSATDD